MPGLLLLGTLLLLFAAPATSRCDTTIVVWNKQRIDHDYRVDFARYLIPDARKKYKRITMTYKLECARTGCDPWDRIGEIFILDPEKAAPYSTDDLNPLYFDVPRYELGRFVTAYGEGWTWEFDVSHMRPMLHDSVTFGTYITVFERTNHHNDPIGYYVTMTLRFEEGEPDFTATGIDLLWRGAFLLGDPGDPIESHLAPMEVRPSEEFAVVRVTASGHGQKNTGNAGEFMRMLHMLKAGKGLFAHYLWRDDCDKVAAGEQYGTWKHSRAGFCPGSITYPWLNDVSRFYRPGESLGLDYDVEPYLNNCRPGVEPCPCDNCEFVGDHTHPHIVIDGQIIYYRAAPSTPELGDRFEVTQGASPEILLLRSRLGKPVDVVITLLNPLGTTLYYHVVRGMRSQTIEIDMATTPGRYLLKVETPDGVFRKVVEVGM